MDRYRTLSTWTAPASTTRGQVFARIAALAGIEVSEAGGGREQDGRADGAAQGGGSGHRAGGLARESGATGPAIIIGACGRPGFRGAARAASR
jgi:hypothetical protein